MCICVQRDSTLETAEMIEEQKTNIENLRLLCHPVTREPLVLADGALHAARSGDCFPVREGIPRLLPPGERPLRHRYWEWVYNRVAIGYDLGVEIGWRLPLGGAAIDRASYLEKIRPRPGERVLETAVGTAANILQLSDHAHYAGLDMAFNMLRRAAARLRQQDRQALLVQGDAHALPFVDAAFDVVFQMGAMQFISDPARALREMARVAKPGAAVWVIDETDALPRTLKRALRAAPPARPEWQAAFRRVLPPTSEQVRLEIISQGELYCLCFYAGKENGRL